MEQTIAAMKPRNAFGRGVRDATMRLHRYAVQITHVDSGALRASHMMRVTNTTGEIYINPNARRGKTRPAEYGAIEHRRGGSHAFYQRTLDEHSSEALQAAHRAILAGLP
jgi:hypothetical protein